VGGGEEEMFVVRDEESWAVGRRSMEPVGGARFVVQGTAAGRPFAIPLEELPSSIAVARQRAVVAVATAGYVRAAWAGVWRIHKNGHAEVVFWHEGGFQRFALANSGRWFLFQESDGGPAEVRPTDSNRRLGALQGIDRDQVLRIASDDSAVFALDTKRGRLRYLDATTGAELEVSGLPWAEARPSYFPVDRNRLVVLIGSELVWARMSEGSVEGVLRSGCPAGYDDLEMVTADGLLAQARRVDGGVDVVSASGLLVLRTGREGDTEVGSQSSTIEAMSVALTPGGDLVLEDRDTRRRRAVLRVVDPDGLLREGAWELSGKVELGATSGGSVSFESLSLNPGEIVLRGGGAAWYDRGQGRFVFRNLGE
jgi:hypothetical protein